MSLYKRYFDTVI